jgi:hypothetical protein
MEIIQILPDVFEEEVSTRLALTLQVKKKYTGTILHFLKSFIADKNVFIKHIESDISDYAFGKYNHKLKKILGDYIQIDISFLKMVKSISSDENIIMIGFIEVIRNY